MYISQVVLTIYIYIFFLRYLRLFEVFNLSGKYLLWDASRQGNICQTFVWLGKCQSGCVWSGKCLAGICLVGEMSVGDVPGRRSVLRGCVWSGKCPSGMCLVGEVSIGNVSGRGNVRRGRVCRGNVRWGCDRESIQGVK